jgi:hypothetical protein
MIVAYIRPEPSGLPGTEMIEVAPGEAVARPYVVAEGLARDEVAKPLEAVKAEAEAAIVKEHKKAIAKAEKAKAAPPPAPKPLSKSIIGAIRWYAAQGRRVAVIAKELGLDLPRVKAVVAAV